MIYRQKILLALIEVCGGVLCKTDFQKLLFLFCKYNGVDYYEFFPYKYGAFSLMSYYDIRKLTQRKLLDDTDNFEIRSTRSFLTSLRREDATSLQKFAETTGHLRGENLIRQTYLEFPDYAKKSEIVAGLLSDDQLRIVRSEQIGTDSEELFTNSEELFTIGYEGISIDGYLNRLIEKDIQLVIDVRKNPVSRKYGFSRRNLKKNLARVDISYAHEPDVGVASHLRQSIQAPQDYDRLFEHYARAILPEKKSVLDRIVEAIKIHKRVALTCFEADPQMCHRHKITEAISALTSETIRISHI